MDNILDALENQDRSPLNTEVMTKLLTPAIVTSLEPFVDIKPLIAVYF